MLQQFCLCAVVLKPNENLLQFRADIHNRNLNAIRVVSHGLEVTLFLNKNLVIICGYLLICLLISYLGKADDYIGQRYPSEYFVGFFVCELLNGSVSCVVETHSPLSQVLSQIKSLFNSPIPPSHSRIASMKCRLANWAV